MSWCDVPEAVVGIGRPRPVSEKSSTGVHHRFSRVPDGDTRTSANKPTPGAQASERVRHDMADEARRLIDAARAEGLTLRLLGGLGVREHCHESRTLRT